LSTKIPRKSTGINFNREAASLYLNEPAAAAFLSSPTLLPAPSGMLVEDFVYLCMIVDYGLEKDSPTPHQQQCAFEGGWLG
jgi:hypothetical protein